MTTVHNLKIYIYIFLYYSYILHNFPQYFSKTYFLKLRYTDFNIILSFFSVLTWWILMCR